MRTQQELDKIDELVKHIAFIYGIKLRPLMTDDDLAAIHNAVCNRWPSALRGVYRPAVSRW